MAVKDDNPGISDKEALVKLIVDWLGSDEFQDRFPGGLTNSEFTAYLYSNILDRPFDAAGHAFWTGSPGQQLADA